MALVEEGGPVAAKETLASCDSASRSNSICEMATSCVSPATTAVCSDAGPPPCLRPAPPIDAVEGLSLSEKQLADIKSLRTAVDSLPVVEQLVEKAPAEKERGWLSGMFSRSSSSICKGVVDSLTWEEVLWLANDMVLYRYLRSYSWDQEQALQQLLQTVRWRRHRRPHLVRPEEVMQTAARGSVYRKGFDVHGHPIVYFKPGREPAQSTKAAQEYTLYTMEKAMQSLDKGRSNDQLVFLVDFTGFSITQVPSMDLSKEVVGILNDHYTDILAKAYMLDAPSYFDAVWKFVRVMLHPLTASKVEFINTSNKKQLAKLLERIPAAYLEESLGGACSVSYDHQKYWEAEARYHEDISKFNQEEVTRLKAEAANSERVVLPKAEANEAATEA
ncbi:hypothetical protein Efla_002292 [Eimeria flavescens]